jgi:hypothetical protein
VTFSSLNLYQAINTKPSKDIISWNYCISL